jgi:hypothetical protein
MVRAPTPPGSRQIAPGATLPITTHVGDYRAAPGNMALRKNTIRVLPEVVPGGALRGCATPVLLPA